MHVLGHNLRIMLIKQDKDHGGEFNSDSSSRETAHFVLFRRLVSHVCGRLGKTLKSGAPCMLTQVCLCLSVLAYSFCCLKSLMRPSFWPDDQQGSSSHKAVLCSYCLMWWGGVSGCCYLVIRSKGKTINACSETSTECANGEPWIYDKVCTLLWKRTVNSILCIFSRKSFSWSSVAFMI